MPQKHTGHSSPAQRDFQLRNWALVLVNTVRSICTLLSGMRVFWRKKTCSVYVLSLLNENNFCPGNEEKKSKSNFWRARVHKVNVLQFTCSSVWIVFSQPLLLQPTTGFSSVYALCARANNDRISS